MLVEKIVSEHQYEAIMEQILILMNKGEDNLSMSEETKLRDLAIAASAYENEHYREKPATISHGNLV